MLWIFNELIYPVENDLNSYHIHSHDPLPVTGMVNDLRRNQENNDLYFEEKNVFCIRMRTVSSENCTLHIVHRRTVYNSVLQYFIQYSCEVF